LSLRSQPLPSPVTHMTTPAPSAHRAAARGPRVAVIAVHGVADQRPNDTNDIVANLLGEQSAGTVRYSAFEQQSIQLTLAPVRVPPTLPAKRSAYHLEENRAYIAAASASDSDWELGHQFMRMQLASYEPAVNRGAYETTVLRAVRTETNAQGAAADEREVHVYEMYWADLSRLATGPLAFFGSLYQLLLHLATLGRQAVDDAAAERVTPLWRSVAWMQRWAVRMLTLPIPMFNVVMLVVGLAVVPITALRDPQWGAGLAVGIVSALLLCTGAYAVARRSTGASPLVWSLAPIAPLALAAGLGYAVTQSKILAPDSWIALSWFVLGGAFVWWLAAAYQTMRPGAVLVALAGYAFAVIVFFIRLAAEHATTTTVAAETAAFVTIVDLIALLRACWIVLMFFALMTAVLWLPLWITGRRGADAWARGNAALRTGRLTLALSTGAFLIVTVIVWSGIFPLALSKLGAFHDYVPAAVLPSSPLVRALLPTTIAAGTSVKEYFQQLVAFSLTGAAPLAMIAAGLGLLLLVWMALPSIRAETDAPSRCTNAQSRSSGAWLSRGLDSTRWVTHLFFVAAFVLPIIGAMYLRDGALMDATQHLATGAAAFVDASALLAVSLIVSTGSGVLDVILDVDNYLRTTPEHGTPRARICERYVSLLRHVASRDENGQLRYDRVVIVAHSLGALISAEFLHFLAAQARRDNGDDTLAALGYASQARGEIPVVLYTMGNPLRQLLDRFFPHRYRWVRLAPDNGARPMRAEQPVTPRAEDATRPDPARLGVARWENAYRSGDYVGRAMWLEEWYQRNAAGGSAGAYPAPLLVVPNLDGIAGEYCIGTGGHTHYWDRSAPDVAARLDALIAMP
jgi:hypothetical protein